MNDAFIVMRIVKIKTNKILTKIKADNWVITRSY